MQRASSKVRIRVTISNDDKFHFFCSVLWHINNCRLFKAKSIFVHINTAHSAGAAEHTDCFSAEEQDCQRVSW